MKYIVDIHESIYNHFKNNEYSRQDVIAIHNSIMDAKPLDNVLDGIRAEIEAIIEYNNHNIDDYDFCSGLIRARNIIDKYRKEQG